MGSNRSNSTIQVLAPLLTLIVITTITASASNPESTPQATEPTCAVTVPARTYTGNPDQPGNIGDAIQTGLYDDGVVPIPSHWVLPDGGLSMKFPFWWEPSLGDTMTFEITAPDIPDQAGRAEPLTAASNDRHVNESLDGRWVFQPWRLIFPTPGCWIITATVGSATLTFTADIVPMRTAATPSPTPTS